MSWPLVEVGELLTAHYGKALKKEHRDESGVHCVYGSSGEIGKHSAALCERPTLVIGRKGSVGEVIWAPNGGWVIDTAYYIELAPAVEADLRYLFYALKRANLASKTITTSIPGLNRDDLYSAVIPLPPLPEQKRIAAILDKADAIRRKRQQAIKLADEFLRSVFLDMFGDPVTNPKGFPVNKLGDLCEDLFLGLTSKVDYVEGENGYPLVRAKDINTGELRFEDAKYISLEQHKKLTKNHLTRKGDLLVSKSGTLGTCAIVRTDREFSTYESIFTVRTDRTKVDLHYLIHLLQNRGFKEKLIGNKVGGTVAHLNLKMFRSFEIGVPPIELQKAFSSTIMRCEAKLEKYSRSGAESASLFDSLSQKAFNGLL